MWVASVETRSKLLNRFFVLFVVDTTDCKRLQVFFLNHEEHEEHEETPLNNLSESFVVKSRNLENLRSQ
jgi:hypothetical protein